jgi:hypothetical protein
VSSNYIDPTPAELDDAPSLLQSAGPFQTDDVDGHGLRPDRETTRTESVSAAPSSPAGLADPEDDHTEDDDTEGHSLGL